MKQPNLGCADVKLNFANMQPTGCACRVSLCDYYDLCGKSQGKSSTDHLGNVMKGDDRDVKELV